MNGFELYSNAEIRKERKFRWWKYFIDFTLSTKYHPALATHIAKWTPPFKFNKGNRSNVPRNPGIYLFFVKPQPQIYIEQSYIMYVGYSMNLHERYGAYLTTYKSSDEPNYFERRVMLNVWEDELYYSYMDLSDCTEKEIQLIEDKIIDSLVPPINRDFANAVIKQQVRLNRM